MLEQAPIAVPGNSSRYFQDRASAQQQARGRLGLAVSSDGHIFNPLHRPELIRYDLSYRTTSCNLAGGGWLPTMSYFSEVLSHLESTNPTICDIGCGQGELVVALRERGLDACGFDPVLREPTAHLRAEYWTATNPAGDADLLVMRCVLPHIPEPWAFLSSLATRRRHVLVEFQRIEWLVDNGVWYGLNHDHVNYFTLSDFERQATVVTSGTFAQGEWAWVLLALDPGVSLSPHGVPPSPSGHAPLRGPMRDAIEGLDTDRRQTANELHASGRDVVLWGAAGKGVVAADGLSELGVAVRAAVDADPDKWGLFLECSGVEVWSPTQLEERIANGSDPFVCVVNPRHIEEVRASLNVSGARATRIVSLAN